jgi:hypothetical protein
MVKKGANTQDQQAIKKLVDNGNKLSEVQSMMPHIDGSIVENFYDHFKSGGKKAAAAEKAAAEKAKGGAI